MAAMAGECTTEPVREHAGTQFPSLSSGGKEDGVTQL